MAWNRSDSRDQRGNRRDRRGVPSVLLAAFVALAIACGVVPWLAARRGGDGVAPTPGKPRRVALIADASTAANVPAATNAVTNPPRHEDPPRVAAASTESTESTESAESAEAQPRNVIVNDGSCRPPDRYAALALSCDRKIAGLLYAVPGQMMIGTVDFGEEFEKQFLESLGTRLEPGQDATDEEREMFEAVNDAKKAVAEAMKREGRTAGEILRETRQQMRELWHYKDMIRQELLRYDADEDKTDQDVSDLFDAANRILGENGIEPFTPNDLTREVVRQYKFDQQDQEDQRKEN